MAKEKKLERILYFLDFPEGFGGAAATLLEQAKLMYEQGMEVMVIIPTDSTGKVIDAFAARCEKYNLPYDFLHFVVTALPEEIDVVSVIDDYDGIKNFILAWKPDIVHSVQLNTAVEMVCRHLKVPHIMNIYQIEDRFFQYDYQEVFPHYHICDSYLYRKMWVRNINTDSVCIRNSLAVGINETKKYEEIVIACAGVLCERKNQLEIIKAVRMLVEEGIPIYLYIYSQLSGTYSEQCMNYVQQNHLEHHVKFIDSVSFVANEIARCSALICGSTVESFPSVISMALATRVPIISTPVAGIPEVLRNLDNAYMCSGYGAADLYDGLKMFYEQRNTMQQKQIIERAYELYREEFSPEAVTKKLIDYYQYVQCDNDKKKEHQLGIEWFKEQYSSLVSLFKQNEQRFSKPNIMKKMLWLIPYMKDSIQNNCRNKVMIIWGAGVYGAEAKIFADIFFEELELKGFVDQKKSGTYLEYPVFNTDKENWENCIIWIANIAGQQNIFKLLQENGKEYQKDFFLIGPRVW